MSAVGNIHLSPHLGDDQFTELLLGGALSDECRSHLAVCDQCRHEAARFTDSVELFSASSLAWTETRPRRSLRATAVRQARRAVVAPLGWALAAAALILVGLPVWNNSHHVSPAQDAAVTTAAQDSPAEIAQDNQLMQSVNLALNTEDASPLPEYRLNESPHRLARTNSRIP